MTRDPDLVPAYTPIEKGIEAVERKIRSQIKLEGIAEPRLLFSGKRLRASAVLFSSGDFSGERPEVVALAASVELVHAASLVHDDVVDEARYRRNDQALSFRYGNAIAVLVGDFLFNQALKLVNGIGRPDILRALLESVSEMIQGELEEEILPPEVRAREEVYLRIIREKTASLFRVSFVSGGLIKEDNSQEVEILRRLGQSFGMAYQIIDDCEDLFADEDGDVLQDKITLPLIPIFRENPDLLGNYLKKDFKELKSAVIRLGGYEYALRKAREYTEDGKKAVSHYPDSVTREALLGFLGYLEKKRRRALKDAMKVASSKFQ